MAAAEPRPKIVQPVDKDDREEPRPRDRAADRGEREEEGQLHRGCDRHDRAELCGVLLGAEQCAALARIVGVDRHVRIIVHQIREQIQRQRAICKAEPEWIRGKELVASAGREEVEPKSDEIIIRPRDAQGERD